jgi:hypothetical protein
MRIPSTLFLLGALAAAPAPAAAQQQDEPQRQLGAHTHGAGKMGIAIERRTLEIELEAPGSDIVGFEHAARTPEQNKATAEARALLAKPLALIKLPEAAGCKVASAKVKLVGGGRDHGHGHGHSHGKQSSTTAAEPHSEFHAEYKLTCAKPELIQSIEFDYFKIFPRAEQLDVTIIGDKRQTKAKATRERPRIDVKATN